MFQGTGRSLVAGPPGVRAGGKEGGSVWRGQMPGLRRCGKELGVLNYDRKPVEGYVEEQPDSILKRFLCLLYERRIYTIGRTGSQESSEKEVMVMTLVVLS